MFNLNYLCFLQLTVNPEKSESPNEEKSITNAGEDPEAAATLQREENEVNRLKTPLQRNNL